MKNISFLFCINILFLIVFWGCGSSGNGEEFIGTWHKPNNPNRYLVIEHLSDKDYSVTSHNIIKGVLPGMPNNDESASYNFSFQDGKLVGPFNISIIYSNDKLSFNGEEYIK